MRLLLLFLMPVLLSAAPKLSVAVHSERVSEFSPIDAVVSITCDGESEVDPTTFELQGQPVKATYSHQSVQSSLLIINRERKESRLITSHYTIQLPGRPAGRHLLPSLSVVVGGERISSPSTTYVVYGAESSPDFRLEAVVEGGSPLYPGQRCTLVYRLSFADPIDPTYQHLPLFESDGFRKLGDPEVVYDYRGGLTVQEIRQKVQAVSAGNYDFEPSIIEGFPYAKDFFGNRLYEERRMRAETGPVEITISPFPEEGRVDHFDGAVGNVVVKSSLLTSTTPRVGDKMRLRVDLVGKAEWSTIHPPLLSRQTAFVERFRMSDLPPAGEEGVGRKSFTIELRPLEAGVMEIPPVAYALFDPALGSYRVVQSQPIRIRVEESPVLELPEEEIAVAFPVHEEPAPPPCEAIPGVYCVDGTQLQVRGQSSWLWFAFPLVALFLALQGLGSRAIQRMARGRAERDCAAVLLRRARAAVDPERGWHWMERALLSFLEERGFGVPTGPQQLGCEGVEGRARRIWEQIVEFRYAPGGCAAMSQLLAELDALLREER